MCLNCSSPLHRGKKYCSIKCQKEYERKIYIQKWQAGDVDGKRGEYQLSAHVERYIKEKYNNQCAACGWSKENPYTNKIPLEIDHIDGHYDNNTEENLILLCPNCHALTATYKGANKGNGRKVRSKYNL